MFFDNVDIIFPEDSNCQILISEFFIVNVMKIIKQN